MTVTKTQKRRLDQLKQHPKQANHFDDLSVAEMQELVDSIEQNGLQHPVVINSDNTIISGHQRVAAAKSLEWTKIDVIVRDFNSEAEEEIFLIQENTVRRQLTPFQKARMGLQVKKLLNSGKMSPAERGKTRDYIGGLVGLGGRMLDFYFQLFETPDEIQTACEQGNLPIATGARVASLPKSTQNKIARAIRKEGFEHAKQIVADELPPPYKAPPLLLNSFSVLCQSLRSAQQDLLTEDGSVRSMSQYSWCIDSDKINQLKSGESFLAKLIRAAEDSLGTSS